jgi:hypothetical protein
MTALLFMSCFFHDARGHDLHQRPVAGDQLPACVKAFKDNDEKGKNEEYGRFGLRIVMKSKVAVLRVGGEWTREKPFYVDVPLGFYVYLNVFIALPENELHPHNPQPRTSLNAT